MLSLHNLDQHVYKQNRFAWGNSHRGNAFLDIGVQYFLQFYFQQYECDLSMLDFHLSKLLKILLKIHAHSKPIYIQIQKLQWNIIFFDGLWKKENLVFLTFNNNLLALNQLLTFVSSLFIFSNKMLMSLKQDVNVTMWEEKIFVARKHDWI